MNDAANNPTTVTTPSETEVRIERELDAPRDLVWKTYTDPELLTEWLGPRRLRMTVQEMDVRAGGSYRYTHEDENDENGAYVFFGEFREVEPPHLLVQTFQWEGNDQPPSVDRVEFEELEADRTRIVVTGTFASQEARDAILEAGMERGVSDGYEKLDELLARRA